MIMINSGLKGLICPNFILGIYSATGDLWLCHRMYCIDLWCKITSRFISQCKMCWQDIHIARGLAINMF